MEEESSSRRSVAELAGRFKSPTLPVDAAKDQTDRPVRRRPPCSLQLHKTDQEEQEAPNVTSPVSSKSKRNSALIEKLQASLALSPSPQQPSPKSPGFRVLPPAFPLTPPGSSPVTTASWDRDGPVVASPFSEEEGPVSFEAPPTATESSILSNVNKSRARHSIRRRPPSRRHRKSSCGEDVISTNDDAEHGQQEGTQPEGPEAVQAEEQKDDWVCPEPSPSSREEKKEEEERTKGEEEKGEDTSTLVWEEEKMGRGEGDTQRDNQTGEETMETSAL